MSRSQAIIGCFTLRLFRWMSVALSVARCFPGLTANAAAHPANAATLSLVVLTSDLCNGRPVADGLVLVAGPEKAIEPNGDDGRALFWGLLDGEYLIYEQAAGYQPIGALNQRPVGVSIALAEPPPIVLLPMAPLDEPGIGPCRARP